MLPVRRFGVRGGYLKILVSVRRLVALQLVYYRLRFLSPPKLAQARDKCAQRKIRSPSTHGEFAKVRCFIIVAMMIVGERNEAEETSSLRVIGIQAQAAKQSV